MIVKEHYITITLVIIYTIIALDVLFTYLRNRKERKRRAELADIERKAANKYYERWFKMVTGVDLDREL